MCEETTKEECFSFDVDKCEAVEETICNEVNETTCVPITNNVTDIDVDRWDIVVTLSLILIGMFQRSCDIMQQCDYSAL